MHSSLDRSGPSPRRPALLLLVVLAHLGTAWLLERQRLHEPRARPVATSVEIRLLPATRRAQAPTQVIQPIWVPPVADDFPLPPVPSIHQIQATTDTRTASIPAAPASAASAPLRLNLPLDMLARPTLQDQIHADPRSHSPRATVESRVADAVGPLDYQVEQFSNGSVQVRQGSSCVVAEHMHQADVDPMDQRMRNVPRAVRKCR